MLKYEDGIHVISNELYHGSEGISRSRLMSYKKSPLHYLKPKEFKTSASMTIGSLVHTLLLEPAIFSDEFAIVPEINKKTKLGKQQWEAFLLEHAGKTLVTDKQINQANEMISSLLANEDAKRLLSLDDLLIENSIFWTDKESKLQFKSRPDVMVGDTGVILDLKTTADASPWSFSNSAWKFGYFSQAAMASEALKSIGQTMKQFIIIAVENTEPYVPAIYILDQDSIEQATEEFHKLAGKLSHSIENNEWPDFGCSILTAPKYAEYDDE